MSKAHTLRALMTARLAAATEEVLVLFERTIQEYEEELRLSKEETHRTQAVLDSLLYPRVRLHQAAAEESPEPALNHGPDTEIPEPSQIKEEPEEQAVKPEQDQLPEQFPECSAVCVKNLESSQQPELKEETLEPHLLPETEPDPAHSYDDWGGPFSCSNLQDHNNQFPVDAVGAAVSWSRTRLCRGRPRSVPNVYDHYPSQDAQRKRIYRASLSTEERLHQNQLSKQRMQRYRRRLKEKNRACQEHHNHTGPEEHRPSPARRTRTTQDQSNTAPVLPGEPEPHRTRGAPPQS